MRESKHAQRSARQRGRCLVAPLLAVLLACGLAEDGTQRRPDILLVTLDTARADHFGAYGYREGHTPNFDRLAEDGVLFELAMAPTPLTLPSHTSILTGVYPTAHGIQNNGASALSGEAILLSEVLRTRGWRTGAFIGSAVLDAQYGLDQGFEIYAGPRPPEEYVRDAAAVVDEASLWLSSLEGDAPVFLWIHFYDPHFPYQARPEEFADLSHPYDHEIAYSDAQLGRLLKVLEGRKRAHPLLTAVTADHGESLGEHGERTHGFLIQQSTLRVPLVISGEPVAGALGTRVSRPVSNVALAPTLLQLAGVPLEAMPDVRFRPLIARTTTAATAIAESTAETTAEPTARAATADDDSIYFENRLPYDAHRWRAGRGLMRKQWKLIEGYPSQLYAISEDPSELRDLAALRPELVGELQSRLEELVASHPPLDWQEGHEISDAERRQLEALGYWEASGGDDPFDPELPETRDRLADLPIMRESRALLNVAESELGEPGAITWHRRRELAGMLTRAYELIGPVRERNPGSPAIARIVSRLESHRGNDEGAAQILEELLHSGAGTRDDRFQLGVLHERLGQSEQALEEMEALVARYPDYTSPYGWLFQHYRAADDLENAALWAERLLGVLESESPQRAEVERFLAEASEQRALRAGAVQPSR